MSDFSVGEKNVVFLSLPTRADLSLRRGVRAVGKIEGFDEMRRHGELIRMMRGGIVVDAGKFFDEIHIRLPLILYPVIKANGRDANAICKLLLGKV